MWICHRCGKPVFFAERRQSIGFDWHPYCLKCTECGKVLNPGQHAEHKSAPYCHIPCYSALFGPKLFGHGSTTESHRSFGRRSQSFIRLETELSNRVKEYNKYYTDTARCQLLSREVNERLVLEGVLKVYWGTECSIRLKEYGDNRVINRHKKTLSLGFEFANVKYENSENEISLVFPPQLGDLSFDLGESTSLNLNSESLQKWETSTTLDREGNEQLNVQLLESLIDADSESLKSLSRTKLVQRSQSVRFNPDYKPSSKPKPSRLSCNLSETEFVLPKHCESSTDELDSEPDNEQSQSFATSEHSHSTMKPSLNLNHDIFDPLNLNHDIIDPACDISNAQDDLEINGNHSAVTNLVDTIVESNGLLETNENKPHAAMITSVDEDGSEDKENMNILDNSVGNQSKLSEENSKMDNDADNHGVVLRQKKAAPPSFKLGAYESLLPSKTEKVEAFVSGNPRHSLPAYCLSKDKEVEEYRKTPRALKRRRGKMTRLRRRSSVNGHWFDRETSVFTPPKDSAMSVWTTSLQTNQEVLSTLLNKYKIESEAADFGLYVVKETGERRLVTDSEHPLLLRVNLGPHEDLAKIYLMNKANTNEISHRVAEFIPFSYTELRSFLSMFYDEEEAEADRIRYKYHTMRETMKARLQELKQGEKTGLISIE